MWQCGSFSTSIHTQGCWHLLTSAGKQWVDYGTCIIGRHPQHPVVDCLSIQNLPVLLSGAAAAIFFWLARWALPDFGPTQGLPSYYLV